MPRPTLVLVLAAVLAVAVAIVAVDVNVSMRQNHGTVICVVPSLIQARASVAVIGRCAQRGATFKTHINDEVFPVPITSPVLGLRSSVVGSVLQLVVRPREPGLRRCLHSFPGVGNPNVRGRVFLCR